MSDITRLGLINHGDTSEKERRREFFRIFKDCPIPEDEIFRNLGLFLTPPTLSRVLFMDFLYRQILDVQGIVIEFGCRWGQSLSLFTALRGIYEPFNRLRKVVGFDTFEGLLGVLPEDGPQLNPRMYTVPPGYEEYLDQILKIQEGESPLAHLKKYEIVKGDARKGIHEYLERNPETIIALAFFDLDIYGPTRDCLQAIKGRLTRGSVIGFDELNEHPAPGETLAVKEVLGISRFSIRRFPYSARTSYLVVDGPVE